MTEQQKLLKALAHMVHTFGYREAWQEGMTDDEAIDYARDVLYNFGYDFADQDCEAKLTSLLGFEYKVEDYYP